MEPAPVKTTTEAAPASPGTMFAMCWRSDWAGWSSSSEFCCSHSSG